VTRIIVCGSRKWLDRERIADRLFDCPTDATIVHGNAKGADRIAHQEAQKLGLLVEPHPAEWERYGKRAGIIRNEEMAALGAELCIAFWDGSSVGTRHMMGAAAARGIPVETVPAEDA
jgi:hypothetical protein